MIRQIGKLLRKTRKVQTKLPDLTELTDSANGKAFPNPQSA